MLLVIPKNYQKTSIPKGRFSITIDSDLLKWVDERVKNNTFACRSHGIEFALYELEKKKS